MSETTYDLLGMMGSLVISASLVPQITKVYRTKSAADLSLSFQSLYLLGIVMILIYGYGEMLYPIYVPVTIEFVGALVILVMKLYFDHQEAKNGKIARDADVDLGSM